MRRSEDPRRVGNEKQSPLNPHSSRLPSLSSRHIPVGDDDDYSSGSGAGNPDSSSLVPTQVAGAGNTLEHMTSTADTPCPTCAGAGGWPNVLAEDHDYRITRGWVVCGDCGGSGKRAYNDECPEHGREEAGQ